MHSAVAVLKTNIVNLYAMGVSLSKIQDATNRSIQYIEKVVLEYNTDGTITVNSRLNKLK